MSISCRFNPLQPGRFPSSSAPPICTGIGTEYLLTEVCSTPLLSSRQPTNDTVCSQVGSMQLVVRDFFFFFGSLTYVTCSVPYDPLPDILTAHHRAEHLSPRSQHPGSILANLARPLSTSSSRVDSLDLFCMVVKSLISHHFCFVAALWRYRPTESTPSSLSATCIH